MGILASSINICPFKVEGELPSKAKLFEYVSQRLARHAFQDISQGIEELSIGWVRFDDNSRSDFEDPKGFWKGDYFTMAMRIDKRKVPAALLKKEIKLATDEYKRTHPTLTRVPKQEKEEIKEKAKAKLLAKVLPIPTILEAVWDYDNHTMIFTNLSTKNIEYFEDLFKKTFEPLRLVLQTPYNLAEQVVPANLAEALEAENKAGDKTSVLALINENLWIGQDFLRWFLWQTLEGETENRGNGGHIDDMAFTAYVDNKMVLIGEADDGGGKQKIAISGPQNEWGEARLALCAGKGITDATLIFEVDEDRWVANLKADRFYLAGMKMPKVMKETDGDIDNEECEQDAIFFERMLLLYKVREMFSHVFQKFLNQRLTGWGDAVTAIQEKLAA